MAYYFFRTEPNAVNPALVGCLHFLPGMDGTKVEATYKFLRVLTN